MRARGCAGGHAFFTCKFLPPAVDGATAANGDGGDAATASSSPLLSPLRWGRPVELRLDLAPRLRCAGYGALLRLDAEALQDAWVLLEQRGGR